MSIAMWINNEMNQTELNWAAIPETCLVSSIFGPENSDNDFQCLASLKIGCIDC